MPTYQPKILQRVTDSFECRKRTITSYHQLSTHLSFFTFVQFLKLKSSKNRSSSLPLFYNFIPILLSLFTTTPHHTLFPNLFLLCRNFLLSPCFQLFRRGDTAAAGSEMAPRLFACFGKGKSPSDPSAANTTVDVSAEEQRRGGAVLVELFSSQGCAASPQAELLLSRLGRGDFNLEMPVIVLAFHVDYWDYMGWKDPFGSNQWTVRQKAYVESLKLDTMFTPQVVVQGRTQFVGNDEEALLSTIKDAPRFPSPSFQAEFKRPTTDSLQVTLNGALRSKIDSQGANVMVALYECGLVTDCPSGENKGRVLSSDYVVRKLEKLCTVKDISPKKTVSGTVNFSVWEGFNGGKCGVAVFVQDNSHQILGSQTFNLPDDI